MFITPPNINSHDIKAFFTTRAFNKGNVHIDTALAEELAIPKDNIYLPTQQHTDKVHVLTTSVEPAVADAVVTNRRNTLIGVLVADCVPVLLHDRKMNIIGAVHAGWKGTAAGILGNSIKEMQERFGCNVEDIFLAIGPSIRQCSYEVGEDVREAVLEATGAGDYCRKEDEKYFIDLSSANRIQALNSGILHENIWQSEECTFCNPDKYYSYRFSKGSAGRQGGFIGIW